MFGAVRDSVSPATGAVPVETVAAAVRTVKLATSYFFGGEILSPSEVRSLDFRGHKEVRRSRIAPQSDWLTGDVVTTP
jgi:hypothetical protein